MKLNVLKFQNISPNDEWTRDKNSLTKQGRAYISDHDCLSTQTYCRQEISILCNDKRGKNDVSILLVLVYDLIDFFRDN